MIPTKFLIEEFLKSQGFAIKPGRGNNYFWHINICHNFRKDSVAFARVWNNSRDDREKNIIKVWVNNQTAYLGGYKIRRFDLTHPDSLDQILKLLMSSLNTSVQEQKPEQVDS